VIDAACSTRHAAAPPAAGGGGGGGGGGHARVHRIATRRDLGDFYRYDVGGGTWEALPVSAGKDSAGRMCAAPSARRGHTLTLVPGACPSRAALLGEKRPSIEGVSRHHAGGGGSVHGGGSLWLYGGTGPDKARGDPCIFSDVFVFCLRTQAWCPATLAGSAALPKRAGHTTTLMRHRLVIVGGVHGEPAATLFPDDGRSAAGGKSGSAASAAAAAATAASRRNSSNGESRFEAVKRLSAQWVEANAPRVWVVDTRALHASRLWLPYESPAPPVKGGGSTETAAAAAAALPWPDGAPCWVSAHAAVQSPQAPDELLVFGGRPGVPGRRTSPHVWVLQVDKDLGLDGFGARARQRIDGDGDGDGDGDDDGEEEPPPPADERTGNWWRPLRTVGHMPHPRCHHMLHTINSFHGHASSDLLLLFGGINCVGDAATPLPDSIAAARGEGSAGARAHPSSSGYECASGVANAQLYALHMREMPGGAGADPNFDHDKAEAAWLAKIKAGDGGGGGNAMMNALQMKRRVLDKGANGGAAAPVSLLPAMIARVPTSPSRRPLATASVMRSQAPFAASTRANHRPASSASATFSDLGATTASARLSRSTARRTNSVVSSSSADRGGGGSAFAPDSAVSPPWERSAPTRPPPRAAAAVRGSSRKPPGATTTAVPVLAPVRPRTAPQAMEKTRTVQRFLAEKRRKELARSLHEPSRARVLDQLLRRKLEAQVHVANGAYADDVAGERERKAAEAAAGLARSELQRTLEMDKERASAVEDALAAIGTMQSGGYEEWFAAAWRPSHHRQAPLSAAQQRKVLSDHEKRLAKLARGQL
jgi:hypothetical protein